MEVTSIQTAAECLAGLRDAWRDGPAAAELEAAVAEAGRAASTETSQALKALRAATLVLGRRAGEGAGLRALFRRAIGFYVGRPITTWDEVLWVLDVAIADAQEARRLVRTVVVSVRLGVKGDVPWLANLGAWGDATHELLPLIDSRLARLFPKRRELGGVLYRQLAKTLPHLGAAPEELYDARSAPEGLQWLLDCPLTMDIREQIHSRASPANLTLVRAYLLYLEQGDASGLAALWLAQKIPEHDALLRRAADPAALKRKLIEYTRELEAILTRLYAFDPESPDSVLGHVTLWLRAVGTRAPPGAAALLDQCRARDYRAAVVTLAAMRQALAGALDAAAPDDALPRLYLDLELEKLGYLLFGDVVNVDFAEVTAGALPEVIRCLHAMIDSESLKGWESPRLAWLGQALLHLAADPTSELAQLMVLVHQINDEIARVGLASYQDYAEIARPMLEACRVPNVDVEVNRFVDGLIRGTTLQHLGELALRLHHYTLAALEALGDGAAADVRTRVERYHGEFEAAAARAAPEEAPTPLWIQRFQSGQPLEPERGAAALGNKGANLCAMCALGLPVPPGFIVSVGACERYQSIHALDPAVHGEIRAALAWLESVTGRRFGSTREPLLVSVRSGAPVSMPGMLDTILNVGLTDAIARALGATLGDDGAAADSYLHFLMGYAKSVFALEGLPGAWRAAPTWAIVAQAKRRILDAGLPPFWERAEAQIIPAIEAVFRSWNNPHAVLFRRVHHLPQVGCTAATVQQMVLGNADAQSCTGVAYTRAPMTGERRLDGEYLARAHGEDLVAGIETPLPILPSPDHPGQSLEETMPEIVAQLREAGRVLEARFGVPQDIEFTVERGTLYLLQTRAARPAGAGVEGAREPAVPPAPGETATPSPAVELPRYRVVARGLGASPGGVAGRIALSPEAVQRFAGAGEAALFVRETTTPADLGGMTAAAGVLTQRGGVTSHAANNARYMGKPCVVGCLALVIDAANGTVTLGDRVLREGDTLVINGMSGEVGVPLA